VGTGAVMVNMVSGGNGTFLTWEQLKELQARGWGIASHSYWHTGNHWDPTQALAPADFRRELYWSQAMFAALLGDSRCPIHFVYPNGDPGYGRYLAEYGLLSATRVGGPCASVAPGSDLPQLGRAYLDEGPWKGKPAMQDFPAQRPADGALIIDFTHAMEADPASENHQRWSERLATIERRHGAGGDGSLWCAPTGTVVAYAKVAQAAKVAATAAGVRITVPDGLPGSALTIRADQVPEKAAIPVPAGGAVFRQGSSAWITTGPIGAAGLAAITPKLVLAYSGPVGEARFPKPVRVAAVRLRQMGEVAAGYALAITCTTPAGAVPLPLIGPDATLGGAWGRWRLLPTVPDGKPITASAVTVATDQALSAMEVWALAD
jgi:hypothetical protein